MISIPLRIKSMVKSSMTPRYAACLLLVSLLATLHQVDASVGATSFSATVDPTAPVVPDVLFGQNFEQTRHDIWNGISPQLIANRQFAQQPVTAAGWPIPFPVGRPPRWEPIGVPTFPSKTYSVALANTTDPAAQLNVTQTSVTCVASNMFKKDCGVQQGTYFGGFNTGYQGYGSSIDLAPGTYYEFEVAVLVDSLTQPTDLTVKLSGSHGKTPFSWSTDFVVAPTSSGTPDFQTYRATFNTVSTKDKRALQDLVLAVTMSQTRSGSPGSGAVSLLATSLMSADHSNGLSAKVVEGLSSLQFRGTLRYPGGCFTPFYKWKEALAPRLIRPVAMTPPNYCPAVAGGVNGYSDGFQQDVVNIDEYMWLIGRLQMVPGVTIPLQFATAEELKEAHDMIEYMNGNTSTTYGKLRAQRGNSSPYAVKHFYLGNEMNFQLRFPDYPAQPNNYSNIPTPQEYAGFLAKLIPVVHQAANAPINELRLVVVGFDAAWNTAWSSDPNVAPYIDATSWHGGYGNGATVLPTDFTASGKAGSRSPLLQQIQALHPSIGKALISLDEYGFRPWEDYTFDVASGMYAASFYGLVLTQFTKLGIGYANYFEPINEGAISVGRQDDVKLTPLADVFRLFSDYQGSRGCKMMSSNTTLEDDVVLVSAACDTLPPADSQTSYVGYLVTAINRNAQEGHNITVALNNNGSSVLPRALRVQSATQTTVTCRGLLPSTGGAPVMKTTMFDRREVQATVTTTGSMTVLAFAAPQYSIVRCSVAIKKTKRI